MQVIKSKLTHKIVKAVWKTMSKKYGFRVISSRSFMARIYYKRRAQKLLGLDNLNKFLKTRTIFVPVLNIILTPYTIGSKRWDVLKQLGLLFHELTHVIDANNEALTNSRFSSFSQGVWLGKYARDKGFRALSEARALLSEIDCYDFVGDPAKLTDVRWQKTYKLGKYDVNTARNTYTKGSRKYGHAFCGMSSAPIFKELVKQGAAK